MHVDPLTAGWYGQMKLNVCFCVALCSVSAIQAAEPVEVTPVAKMDCRTNDRTREPGIFGDYWWANRFLSRHRCIEALRGKTVDVVMIGDSITHFWEWRHPENWLKFTTGRTVLNLGYGGDRTENVIWRLTHGELDGYTAKNVVIEIGTNNNSGHAISTNVANGIVKIIDIVKEHQPTARIILHPIFPRGASERNRGHAYARWRNDRTNELLQKWMAMRPDVVWLDFNAKFLDATGWVPKALMADEIHPTDAGYDIWSAALAPVLKTE